MTPFDPLAPLYASLWSEAPEGVRQREEVWREIDALFRAGDRVLDLGCGTGDDALHLGERGVAVLGIDSSAAMVAKARSRGVAARELAIEALHQAPGVYDGALSNFGALNCVADPGAVAIALASVVLPGGWVAICVLSRFWWRESLRFALAGDFAATVRRWRGQVRWRGIPIYYRSVRQWRAAFAPHFVLIRSVAIGGGDHRLLLFRRFA